MKMLANAILIMLALCLPIVSGGFINQPGYNHTPIYNNHLRQHLQAQTKRNALQQQQLQLQTQQRLLAQRQAALKRQQERIKIRQQQIAALTQACHQAKSLTFQQRNTCQALENAKRFHMPLDDKRLGLISTH